MFPEFVTTETLLPESPVRVKVPTVTESIVKFPGLELVIVI